MHAQNFTAGFPCDVPGCPRVGGRAFKRKDHLIQHWRFKHLIEGPPHPRITSSEHSRIIPLENNENFHPRDEAECVDPFCYYPGGAADCFPDFISTVPR